MVLRSDFHFAGFQILDRLVAAAMAELELESFAAERKAKDLMAKTDSKSRNPAGHNIAHGLRSVGQSRRIAGTIGKKNARRFVLQGFARRSRGRNHLHFES